MKIAKIKIQNILGIQDLELTAGGKFNIIQGQNGKGKTSVLEAIKLALGSGSDATVLRKGETKGQVVLLMDDDTEISATVNHEGKVSRSLVSNGEKSKQPVSDIKAIADAIGINPAEFISNPKSRTEIIIRAINYKVDTQELKDMFGVDFPEGGIEVLDEVRKYLFDQRTGVNRAKKEKESTIKQMNQAIDKTIPHYSDIESSIQALRSDVELILAQMSQSRNEVKSKYFEEEESLKKFGVDAAIDAETKIRQIKAEALSKETEAKSAMDEEVRAIQDKYGKIISSIKDNAEHDIRAVRVLSDSDIEEKKKLLLEVQAKIDAETKEKTEHFSALRATKLEEIAAMQERLKQSIKQEQIVKTVTEMSGQCESLGNESSMLTASIQAVDDMRKDVFKSIPIPGLTVEDGKVMIDGIDFDRLNTANQVHVAMQVSAMRSSKLRAICVDGIECLDSESMLAMIDWAEGNDCQLFVTRVTDNAMEIKSE